MQWGDFSSAGKQPALVRLILRGLRFLFFFLLFGRGFSGSGSGRSAITRLLQLINLTKDFAHEGSRMRASMHGIIVRFALVKRGKGILRILGWDKAGEPCGRALFALWAPLGRARLAGNPHSLDLGGMGGPLPLVDDILQPTP